MALEHDIAELEANLRSSRAEATALRNENAALRTTSELLAADKALLTSRLEVEVRANEKCMTLLEAQAADLTMGIRAIKNANAARMKPLQEAGLGVGGPDPSPVAPKSEPTSRSMKPLPEKPEAEYYGDGRPRPVARGSMRAGITYEDRETGDVWTLQPDSTWACTWFNNFAKDGGRVNVDPPANVPALRPVRDPTDLNVAMGFAPEDTRPPARRPIREGVEQDEYDANNVKPKHRGGGFVDQTLADRDSRIPKNVMTGLDTDHDRMALGAMAENLLRKTR